MSLQPDSPLEVLIVEDSHTQALLLGEILRRSSFRVTVTVDGALALEALKTLRPALVLSDIHMPNIDGYQLCERIKANADLQDTPVILMTGLAEPKDIVKALQCGADRFVVKPYRAEFLVDCVRSALATKEHDDDAPPEQAAIPIHFGAETFMMNAGRRQIFDLLLATCQSAAKLDRDLVETMQELKAAQKQLHT